MDLSSEVLMVVGPNGSAANLSLGGASGPIAAYFTRAGAERGKARTLGFVGLRRNIFKKKRDLPHPRESGTC